MPARTAKSTYIVSNNIEKYRLLKENPKTLKPYTRTEMSFKTGIPKDNIRSWEIQRFQPRPASRKKLIRFLGNHEDLFIFHTPEIL